MAGIDWFPVFGTVDFLYWGSRAGFFAPPIFNSDKVNRSDLRWDNYDGTLQKDLNNWVEEANKKFAQYTPKVIAYAGRLKPTVSELSAERAAARIFAAAIYNNHQRLEFANETMFYGLKQNFGLTDGMVPYYSSLLCDKGPVIGPPDPNFFCLSPTRVRRFDPGSGSVLDPEPNTLSIDRRARGYDHQDMRDDETVLNWVVKDLLANRPHPVVSTSLKLSPPDSSYRIGDPIKGTFSVANRGTSDVVMNKVLIGGRLAGAGERPYDFEPAPGWITLKPGEVRDYSGSFTPSTAGAYTFAVAYEDQNGNWTMPVEAEKNNVNKVNISVQSVVPRVVVSKSLTLTPGAGPYSPGQTLTGTFGITNRGNTAVLMRQVLIGGRLADICPKDVCPDFLPIPGNITLGPGETYNYSGEIRLSQPGPYTFYVAYQTPDEKWEIPVRAENGTINRLSIQVQGPMPTLTRANPSSVAASTNPQTITIYGTHLANPIYAGLKFPDGTVTYLYLPLNQLFRVSDDQTRITTKFLSRGTYYLTVWTLEGRSNQFPIVVY
jgi:hypothetical protein